MATDIKRVEKPHVLTGTGAPTDGDQLTENTAAYPVNTIYFDKGSGTGYVRAATTKVASDDWKAGSAGGGGGAATSLTLTDSNDVQWQVTVNTFGALTTTQI